LGLGGGADTARHGRDYQTFKDIYKELTGDEWVEQRDAFFLNADSVKAALAKTFGQSEKSYDAWIDDPDRVFNLSPETFAERVRSYLDQRGPKHRIMFLVDEIGQFIGQDGQMMTRCTTRSAVRTSWPMRSPSAAPTRAHRG
jgi:hypothetical protein